MSEFPPSSSSSIEDESSPAESASSSGLIQLTFAEARVLGCLLEKEATTPDNYPLTLNALHSACNQSSNRDPVTSLGTDEVEEAMEGLRYKHLAILVHQAGARVAKNKHTLEQVFPSLTEGERSLLCVLFLRGQQTVGELRQRTERMHTFSDIDSTTATLQRLCHYEPDPLIRFVPSGGGRRAATYVPLFCGEPAESASPAIPESCSSETTVVATPSWREEMERQMAALRDEIDNLKAEVHSLKDDLGA